MAAWGCSATRRGAVVSALARAFPAVPLSARAGEELAVLAEMAADDAAARRHDRGDLAAALVILARAGVRATALTAAKDRVADRQGGGDRSNPAGSRSTAPEIPADVASTAMANAAARATTSLQPVQSIRPRYRASPGRLCPAQATGPVPVTGDPPRRPDLEPQAAVPGA
jgi:hypothetical protein